MSLLAGQTMLTHFAAQVLSLTLVGVCIIALFYQNYGVHPSAATFVDLGSHQATETATTTPVTASGNETVQRASRIQHLTRTLSTHTAPSSLSANLAPVPEALDMNHSKEVADEEIFSPDLKIYHVVRSRTTQHGTYFTVDFRGTEAYNVNILPHFTKPDRWYAVAHHNQFRNGVLSSVQVVCVASFAGDVLRCTEPPTTLPLARSIQGQCKGKWTYYNLRPGAHDARVFNGPDEPYIIYGSLSSWSCFGMWLQNFRFYIDQADHPPPGTLFQELVEVHRPSPSAVEKNLFLFWDLAGDVYAHYDVWPRRAFSRIDSSGGPTLMDSTSINLDLDLLSSKLDQLCMAKYLPLRNRLAGVVDMDSNQTIHQATNSLAVTMCNSLDSACEPKTDNTFIMHIFHLVTRYKGHARYEPYVLLFRQRAPFEVHAISTKAIWIHGRDIVRPETYPKLFAETDMKLSDNHTEQVYITSITWKAHNQTYHGYLDDELFIGFGVEDAFAGAIDVLAVDLIQDLAFCEDSVEVATERTSESVGDVLSTSNETTVSKVRTNKGRTT